MDGVYLFEHPGGILAYLHEPHDDIVQIDVTQGGVVFAFPPYLVQEQIPAVHRRQQVLVFPERERRTGLPTGPAKRDAAPVGGGAPADVPATVHCGLSVS